MPWDIYHYGNTSCQVGHLLLIGTHHTILANQISITDFCQGSVILILLANRLTYFNIIHQAAIIL